MIIEIKRQVKFSEDTKYGSYSSAIYFTDEEYDGLTYEDIQAQCQAILDAWTAFMAIPVLAQVETLPELLQQKADLQIKIDEINLKISQL